MAFAAEKLDIGAVEALLAAGADPCEMCGSGRGTALSMAAMFAETAPKEAQGVESTTAAVIDLCAQAQLGMSYPEHVATLTVGAAVKCIRAPRLITALGGSEFTIVEVDESTGELLLEDASGKQREVPKSWAAQLRLKA